MPRHYDFEKSMDAKLSRRFKNEDRFLARRERLEAKIERQRMIGEICREGRTVYYFFPVGKRNPYEGSHAAVVEYIIKNGYVQ